MKGLTDTTYGDAIADIYDDMHAIAADDAVEMIAQLAANGRVLELGVGTGRVAVDSVVLEATRHDRNAQKLDAQLVVISTRGTRLIPLELRYCFPAELDLMAEFAGMRLRERYASFARAPFTQHSMQHVSIYEKV